MKRTVRVRTARELWGNLTQIFPRFAEEFTAEELAGLESEGTASVHSVMLPFTEYFGSHHSTFSERELRLLASLLNRAAAVTDELENAVSICFLEHLHQIGSYKVLARFLSTEAKRRTRA